MCVSATDNRKGCSVLSRDELIDAVNRHRRVRFQGCEYYAVGYQVLRTRESIKYSAGLQDIKQPKSLLWVLLSDVDVVD